MTTLTDFSSTPSLDRSMLVFALLFAPLAGLADGRGGSVGSPNTEQDGTCENVGAKFAPPTVIDAGSTICPTSNGPNVVLGQDESGEDVVYNPSTCPSEITYEPAHRKRVAKPGMKVTSPTKSPRLKQAFFCDVNPFFSVCTPEGGPMPQASSVTSWTEETCEKHSPGMAGFGGAR